MMSSREWSYIFAGGETEHNPMILSNNGKLTDSCQWLGQDELST